MRIMLPTIVTATVLLGSISTAFAGSATCNAAVVDKKLAGAAKSSFLKKCQTDAKLQCDSNAASRKLSGAAKSSFTKKCVSDAVGA